MPRSQTFGYNAAAGVHELVVDRLLGAQYDNGTIPDTYGRGFTNQEWNIGVDVHVLLKDLTLSLDPPNNLDQHVVLVLNVHAIVQFASPPPVPFLQQEEEFEATVSVPLKLLVDPKTEEVEPDFGAVNTQTITVAVDPSVGHLRRTFIEGQLPEWIPEVLKNLSANFKLPIALDTKPLMSDAFDLALVNDTTSNDTDSVNLLFYSKLDPSSRGNPDGVVSFLEKDKSFTFMLSRAVFDQLMAVFIDWRFVRFNATVGKSELTREHVVFSAPDSSGIVSIEGQKIDNRSGVRGEIRNATQGGKVDFSTKKDGTFKVMLAASIGDVLEVRGTAIEFSGGGQSAVLNYKPSILLSDGYLGFGGVGSLEVLNIKMDVDVDGKVCLSVDPVTGEIVADVPDIELDLPWWADWVLSIATGPFAGFIVSMYEDPLGRDIAGLINQSSGKLVPRFRDAENMVVFFESIAVKQNSVVLSGQIEAGLIHRAGRSDELSAYLDASESNTVGQSFDLFPTSRHVCTDPDWMKQFAEYGLVRLGKVNFELLSYDDLAAKSYTSDSATVPGAGPLAGEVFAVKTAWDRYAKVRIDQTKTGKFILRWVTYETPRGSEVTIEGKWKSDLTSFQGSSGILWHNVTKYWGTFALKFRRIYTDDTLNIKWTYKGPGTFKFLTWDQRKVSVEVDVDQLGNQTGFSGTLTVEVEDIFGRKATDTIELSGTVPCGEPGPALEKYVDLTELAIFMHGPGPISLPVERGELVQRFQRRVQLYQEAIQQLAGSKARLPDTAVGRCPLDSPGPLSSGAWGAYGESGGSSAVEGMGGDTRRRMSR